MINFFRDGKTRIPGKSVLEGTSSIPAEQTSGSAFFHLLFDVADVVDRSQLRLGT